MIPACENKRPLKLINDIHLTVTAILDIVAGNTYIYEIGKSDLRGFYAEE